jgi:glycosyltransferase involved in cell wall biosynthesis
MQSLKISVAMCTFNGGKYLNQQLDSILNQTLLPHELVICDDCSTDDTLHVLRDFATNAPFNVKIIKNPKNLGYVKNFEQAISHCRTDLIAMCDQDDIWLPDKLKDVEAIFSRHPDVGLVLHNFQHIDGSGHAFFPLQEHYGAEKLVAAQLEEDFKLNSIRSFMEPYPRAWYGCMMVFKSKYLPLILPVYPGKGHDDWILKLLAPVAKVYFLSKPLSEYRIHSNNTNSHEVGHSKLKIWFLRRKKRIYNLLHGYSKKNFYKAIEHRLNQSRLTIMRPDIKDLYVKYLS